MDLQLIVHAVVLSVCSRCVCGAGEDAGPGRAVWRSIAYVWSLLQNRGARPIT